MPEQGSIITKFDDFSFGDYGTLGGKHAPAGSFSAINMLVAADGTLVPRPGLKNITPASMPNGPLLGLASTPVVGKDGIFIIAEKVYRFDLNTPATAPTYMASFAQAPDQPVVPKLDTATLLVPVVYSPSSSSDGTYRVDPGADTVTKLTGSSGGHDVILIDQQVIIARSEFSNQILGSSPTDPNDWTEGRFAEPGDNWQVTSLHWIRNALAILKRTGIHIMTGILGDADTEVFRKVSSVDGPLHPWQSGKDATDQVWFFPVFRRVPEMFNGAQVVSTPYAHLAFPTRENDDTVATTPLKRSVTVVDGDLTPSTIVFVQGGSSNMMLVQHNGKWTFHTFGISMSAMACANGTQLVLTDGGTNVSPAQIYSALFDLNRPAFTGDSLAAPGDNSTTPLTAHVTFPQYWSEGGREVEVRQVIVDFESFNTGTSATNHFDVSVRVFGRARSGEVTYTTTGGAPGAFDEAPAASSTTGTLQRREFNFKCTPGAGFEVSLTDVRGCKIKSVTVLEAQRKQRPIA